MGKFASRSSHFLFCVFCIILLSTICYYTTVWTPFIWDDQHLILNNPQIQNINNLPSIFVSTISTESSSHAFYRPIQMLTYMMDYIFWGSNSVGFHITNIVLHSLVAICLLELVWILSLNRWAAFCAPLLFVTHPIHTEAVTYISGRADPLAATFMLMSIGTYIYAYKKNSTVRSTLNLTISIIFFVLALMSKEHALIVPFILIIYHVAYKSKIRWRSLFPFFVLMIAYIVIRIMGIFIPALELNNPTDASLMSRIPGAFVAVFSYIRLLIIPVNLHMEYGQKVFAIGDSQFIAGLSICALMIILFFKQRRDYPLMSFAIGWFLVGLIPVLNLLPVSAYMAEHWLYFPSMGYFILIGMFFGYLYSKAKKKWIVEIFFIALLATQITLTIRQNQVWKDPIKFYNRIILHNPSYARAHFNLANALAREGNNAEEAIEHYQIAIQMDAKNADAYNNLGTLYQHEGDLAKAYSSYMRALQADPQHLDANNNIGGILLDQRQYEEALIYFNRVIKSDPNFAKAHNNLGILYAQQRKFELAVTHFKQALIINPDFDEARNNLQDVMKFLRKRRSESTL